MKDKMVLKKKIHVGNLLIEKELITEEQLVDALANQKLSGEKIGRVLTDLGFISEDKLLSCLSDYFVGNLCQALSLYCFGRATRWFAYWLIRSDRPYGY
jgi:hypothetical protein